MIASDFFLKVISGQIAGFREHGHEVLLLCRAHAIEFGGDQEERDRHLAAMDVPVIELRSKLSGVALRGAGSISTCT